MSSPDAGKGKRRRGQQRMEFIKEGSKFSIYFGIEYLKKEEGYTCK